VLLNKVAVRTLSHSLLDWNCRLNSWNLWKLFFHGGPAQHIINCDRPLYFYCIKEVTFMWKIVRLRC